MANVLIEFYDRDNIDNILSLLHGRYERVYCLYYPAAPFVKKTDLAALSDFIVSHFSVRPVFLKVRRNTIDAFLSVFESVVRAGDTYEFDITGGSDIYIAAAGCFVGSHASESVTLHRYGAKTDRMLMRYPAPPEDRPRLLSLSVPDMIALRGTFLTRGESDGRLFRSDRTDREVRALWHAVKDVSGSWNKFCMLRPVAAPEGRQCRRPTSSEELATAHKIVSRLKSAGLVSHVSFDTAGGRTYLTFTPCVAPENEKLLLQAGTVLERYACLCAEDSGLFSDVRTGIEIDWDGLPSRNADNPYNEIDLMLVFDNTAVLASCKNREPSKEDLYEITVMARHFGGKYAVPMLLCTQPAQGGVAVRAKEMGVFLIDGIKSRSEKNLIARLSELIRKSRA